jgi:electron transport complex protein RnfG
MSADVEPTAVAGVDPAAQLPARQEVPSWRLVATLAVAGALAALLLSFVYEATKPLIDANKARVLSEAVAEVLGDPVAVVSLVVKDEGLVPDATPVYLNEKGVERVYLGYADEARTKPIGFALRGEAYGYGSDPIQLVFGYDAGSGEILGLKVLGHKETPGIGTKIETQESFAGLFWKSGSGDRPARQPPLVGQRAEQFQVSDPHHVDMISGATISSKAVIKAVDDVWTRLGPRLKAFAGKEGA